jgi:hypothetical protein
MAHAQSVMFIYILLFAAFGVFYTIGNLCLLGRYLASPISTPAQIHRLHHVGTGADRHCVCVCVHNSSFFLIGPTRQLKMMFKPIRLVASVIYIAALGMTLFVAIYVHSPSLSFAREIPC